MKLDLVHDIQNMYRKILNSMSRPGVLENIEEETKEIQSIGHVYSGTVGLMYMFLDREVSYNLFCKKREETTKILNQLVYGNLTETEDADFIFVAAGEKYLKEALITAKRGTLVDPHKSATIICQVESLSNEGDLILKGPGIKDMNYVSITGIKEWLEVREVTNSEFPLGVDLIFVDKLNNIISIPRTTKIIREVK